ncbi:MAG: hypothetical protein R3D00_03695 [Bacteroidia bacterium]
MKDIKNTLILLYAKYEVAFLDLNGKVIANALEKNSKDDLSFDEEQEIYRWQTPIREAKLKLERRVSFEQLPDEQVIHCLKFAYELIDESKRTYNPSLNRQKQILRALISSTFFHIWTSEIQSHFNLIFDKLMGWNCFFFSFDIDFLPYRQYKELIKAIIQSSKILVNEKELKKNNSFAIILSEYLRLNGVIGHHTHSTYLGITPELGDHCEKSMTFIQLINRDILHKVGNNCFQEYKIFMNHNGSSLREVRERIVKEKCFFISTDTLTSENLPSTHTDWYTDISTNQILITSNPEEFMSLAEKIKHHILTARNQAIEAILDQIKSQAVAPPSDFETDPKAYINYLISQNKLKIALEKLEYKSKEAEKPYYNDVLGLQSRLTGIESEKAKGLVTANEYLIQIANVRDGIIQLVDLFM